VTSPPLPPPPVRSEPAHVLVVEDNPINALVAMESLKRFGMRATHVLDGEQALKALAVNTYDLVLMDCQMPGLDGFETTQRWRALEAAAGGAARLPIIAVTANAASGDRERCLACGMDDYVAKPFDLHVLRATIERHLRAAGPAP
jgi:two-component system, sensor histidine kinase